jgi:hypothetical protein
MSSTEVGITLSYLDFLLPLSVLPVNDQRL